MKPRRNDPCPCGSGRKFKKCCENAQSTLRQQTTRAAAPVLALVPPHAIRHVASPQATVPQQTIRAAAPAQASVAQHAIRHAASPQATVPQQTIRAAAPAQASVAQHAIRHAASPQATVPQPGPARAPSPELRKILAWMNDGRYAELENQMRDFVMQHPTSGLAWKALSVSLSMQGKDALHALERAATLLPEDAEAHGNLGSARLVLGYLDEAVASYTQVLALKPDLAEAHNNLGKALRLLGRLDDAVESYAKACAIKPDFAEAYCNMGNALRSRGQIDAALAQYAKALKLQPDYAEACNNLGNALLDRGDVDAAASSYRRALEIRPDFAEGHNNLGNALRLQGRLDDAAACYRRALALRPTFSGAHSNLSDALRDLGQLADAVDSSRRAIELEPELVSAHNSLGNALLDLGRLDEAAASYRRALAVNSSFVEGHVNLGLVCRQQGLTVDAEASCMAALLANPRAAAASVLLGELRADHGRFAEAEELFRRALAIDPEIPEAWAGIAHLRKMTEDDAAWAAGAQRVLSRHLLPRQEAYLRFAMGKYFDDIQDFELAFDNFHRANELGKSYGVKYDAQQWTRTVDETLHDHDRAWVARARGSGVTSDRPVFIVGMPRSGTTLAEQILASHPQVFGAGELTFWQGAVPAHAPGPDYLRLLESLSPDALRVIDKMPANFSSLGLIHAALPQARIIHMRRNPIDTCVSIYFQHFRTGHAYANDLHHIAHYYEEYSRLMGHWQSTLPGDAILDVPYEGLVDDQEGWSRKMLQFIGLPWDARCIEFHRTARSVMTASKWQVRQKITRASVQRWRNYEKFVTPLLHLAP